MSTAPEAGSPLRSRGLASALVIVLSLAMAAPAVAAEPPQISATGAVLWVPEEDRVLHGTEETVGRPMASTTKIMTLLLALEAGAADDEVIVSPAAAALGQATLNLRAGQRIPMRSLVAGLLLRSGNDAAAAVAEHVAGSEAAFVDRMNARATELDLHDTAFVNASGLTNDPSHRAAPLDLARLAAVAMEHDVFAEFAGAATANVEGLPPMVSRNELLGRYPGATGVKTGFTALAGNTLVASATRADRTLYAVVLGSENSFADAAALLDHGFEAHRRVAPLDTGDQAALHFRWADLSVPVAPAEAFAVTAALDAPVVWRAQLDPVASRPLREGAPVGRAVLSVGDEVVADVELRTTAAAPARPLDAPPAARAGAALQDALRAFARVAEIERAA